MQNTIFVQIASYKDSELFPTIEDCLKKAKYPKKLRFGIVYQDDTFETKFENDSRFKFIKVNYKESQGACWARHQSNLLYNKETFTLQIDSHTRFVEDWDKKIIDMWSELKDPKAIFTTYPSEYFPDVPETEWMSYPCIAHVYNFTDFIPESRPKLLIDSDRKTPRKAIHVSAGFIFGKGSLIKEVSYDPNLYFLGEETAMTVRLYTHGYNLYHPHELLLRHYYIRKGNDRHWDDHKDWGKLADIAKERIDCLLGRSDSCDLGEYGLGTERTLEEFKQYSGIDFIHKKLHKDTIDAKEPPIHCEGGWEASAMTFSQTIYWDYNEIESPKDVEFWAFVFKDKKNRELYRVDFHKDRYENILNGNVNNAKFSFDYIAYEDEIPKTVIIWPYSKNKGWNETPKKLLLW